VEGDALNMWGMMNMGGMIKMGDMMKMEGSMNMETSEGSVLPVIRLIGRHNANHR
jgi:hypothetical protein